MTPLTSCIDFGAVLQGTLDGICGGILLYLGYALLTHDFPEDAATHCGEATVVSNSPGGWRRRAML